MLVVYNGKYVVTAGKLLGVPSDSPPTPGDFILTFDAIGNAPVGDPTSVSDWNTWFDLPTYGTPFTGVSVEGNEVTLTGATNVTIREYLFGEDLCGPALLSIVDTGCISSIGEGVFSDYGPNEYGCYNLAYADFPAITSLEPYTFSNCENLESFTIHEGVTTIGESVFLGTGLIDITIPASVISIANDVFTLCPVFENIFVSASNNDYTDIDGVLFSKDELTLIIYPEGNSRTSYLIPEGVTTIKEYSFIGCNNLVSITMPNSVSLAGQEAFRSCSNLSSINLSTSLTSLAVGIFSNCPSLASLSIPNNITNIEYQAFSESGLTSITLPSSVEVIGSEAFNPCPATVINSYPLTAPIVNSSAFAPTMGAVLHIKSSGTSGYDVNPWTDASIFTSIVQDL